MEHQDHAGSPSRKMITVFGGSRCREGAAEYQEALVLGRLLAEAGFDIATGGYSGVMEAASRGAHEAGGHVVGITMQQFAATPNPYLKETIPSADFYARLQSLITLSCGYVAVRGGIGTVTEVSLVWNKLMTRVLPARPLILMGACWPGTIESLRQYLVVSDADLDHLSFAANAAEAVALLRALAD